MDSHPQVPHVSQSRWSAKQAWEWLNISRASFYRLLAQDPSFPRPHRLGRTTRWNPQAVARWLEAQ